ncbi:MULTISPECIES: Stk1 family PASTA domain-containing Ser/Thr kinase [Paenibacillus]|uniref:Stk1 family PASTA domain-containing Ser/Thr kinase n=1 Tax=Paenibacillus TaxID=44249 RepID=UPI002041602F|nr:Stk1 family PASTA domain-containing Ser/Thr kinase [Paenibacillus camelliae]MCM3632134.1 Stk1 family PASTA domain-containing Ser/Thr kinase [Paenibacillus camelliae]
MIGHDLAGRYEIISRIGGGGMALVYKAHDVLLNRKVAVKVLRQQFVNDEEFISRFRREAQNAAALSHPNVVSIYDVGQEEDIHYIVMEYVEGHNLNEIIVERAPLQIEEAVHIAQQICDALDHAHANHIIHRDIKPHNILIGNNGRVKVTDFGIARAATSSKITHTGSVVGSVHYFSPEHAKGVNTGEKSDLYSLGIVLYQMVTGNLPFFGESPISIALKHLQDHFEEPRVVNSHIPQSVENIILKSMRKNPNDRYESARAMMADLETCLQPHRLYEPKITFNDAVDMQETKVMPAIRSTSMPNDMNTGQMSSTARYSDTARLTDTASVTMHTGQFVDGEPVKTSGGWKKPLIVVLITLVFLAALLWGFFRLLDSFRTEDVKVPYVVGETEEVARKMLAEAGLNVTEPVTRETSKLIPKDQVIAQSKMSMMVKKGTYIELTISAGPELKELDNYINSMKQQTVNALIDLGVKEAQIDFTEVFDESPAGTILEQSPPAGEEINPDDVLISFTVSKGPELVEMPDLTDARLKEAKLLLESRGLVLEEQDIKYEASYLFEKDHVISQGNAEPNEMVEKGTKVTLVVSSGYPKDAKNYQFNVRISPAMHGSASEVKIYYSDARGENMELEPRTITSTVDISLTLVLDPDTVAKVSVYRDGVFMDIKDIYYGDIAQGSHEMVVPGQELEPTHTPDEETFSRGGEHNENTEANDNDEQSDQPANTTEE